MLSIEACVAKAVAPCADAGMRMDAGMGAVVVDSRKVKERAVEAVIAPCLVAAARHCLGGGTHFVGSFYPTKAPALPVKNVLAPCPRSIL